MPRCARLTGRIEQQVVAAQQARRDRQQPGALDQGRARPRAAGGVPAERLAQRRAECDRAPAGHQETGEHDPRVPRVRRREAAELEPAGSLPGLPGRAGDPRAGEGGRPGKAGRRLKPEHGLSPAVDHDTILRRLGHQLGARDHTETRGFAVTGRLAQADALEAQAGPPGRPGSQTPSPGRAYVAYTMTIPAGHPVTRLLGLTSRAVRRRPFALARGPASPAGVRKGIV